MFSLNDISCVISTFCYTKEHWLAVRFLSSFTSFCLQGVIVFICIIGFLITVSNIVNHTERFLNIKFYKVLADLQAGELLNVDDMGLYAVKTMYFSSLPALNLFTSSLLSSAPPKPNSLNCLMLLGFLTDFSFSIWCLFSLLSKQTQVH